MFIGWKFFVPVWDVTANALIELGEVPQANPDHLNWAPFIPANHPIAPIHVTPSRDRPAKDTPLVAHLYGRRSTRGEQM